MNMVLGIEEEFKFGDESDKQVYANKIANDLK